MSALSTAGVDTRLRVFPMQSDYTPTPGRREINEAMCGIGVFIEASPNGLLTIKHVTPGVCSFGHCCTLQSICYFVDWAFAKTDGPASQISEVQQGDFLVAIDGLTTLGMPMHQVALSSVSFTL